MLLPPQQPHPERSTCTLLPRCEPDNHYTPTALTSGKQTPRRASARLRPLCNRPRSMSCQTSSLDSKLRTRSSSRFGYSLEPKPGRPACRGARPGSELWRVATRPRWRCSRSGTGAAQPVCLSMEPLKRLKSHARMWGHGRTRSTFKRRSRRPIGELAQAARL